MGLSAEELVKRGAEIVSASKSARDIVEQRWRNSNDLYNGEFSPDEKKVSEVLGVPRIFLQKTYTQVRRILIDVMETFFFDFEEIAKVKSWKSIPTETLQIAKTLVNYRLNSHPINFYQESYECALDAIKNKVGILKVYPKIIVRKKGSNRYLIDETGAKVQFTGKESAEEIIKQFAPVIECVPPEDVFFSAQATWKDYWKWPVAHRLRRTREYCRQRGYKNVDQIGAAATVTSNDVMKQQRAERQGSPFTPPAYAAKGLEEIFLFEIWDFDQDGEGFLKSGSYVLGGSETAPQVLMREWADNELPYEFDTTEPVRHPIIVASAYPEPHSMYGKDFPEITEGLQKETNAALNQEREAVARALRPPILFDRNADLDLMALMVRKIGGLVGGGNISETGVREMATSNPIPISAPSRSRIDQDYAEISSISPNQMGVPTSSSQSATMFAGVDRNANKAIAQVVMNLAITGFVPAINYLFRLEQAYESDEFIELVTGRMLGWKFQKNTDPETGKKTYVGASPWSVIQGDFDFYVSLGVGKQGQLSQWAQLLQVGVQSNSTMGQLLQMGAIKAENVKLFNPAFPLAQMAPLLGQKNVEEMYVPAMQPPPPQAGAPGTPGTASAPAMPGNPNGPGAQGV